MKKLDLRLFGQPLSLSGGIGFAIILVSAVIVVAAPYLAPFGETAIVGDVWTGPDNTHWLGLDNLGRDMLSRILYGGRTSIIIAILITTVSFSIGISLGFIAAIAKGWTDSILSWIVDVLMSIPNLIFVLVILSIAGTSIPVLVCTIAAYDWTRVFRLSRNVSLGILAMNFIEVALLRGERLRWVMWQELLPNALPPLAAEFCLRFSFSLLFIASLSFLGLGIQPPFADWGSMVRENAPAISLGVIAPLIPAGAIAILTVGVNLAVDWLLSVNNRVATADL